MYEKLLNRVDKGVLFFFNQNYILKKVDLSKGLFRQTCEYILYENITTTYI